jgi:NitT/TauT family transport system substrate-binding protein
VPLTAVTATSLLVVGCSGAGDGDSDGGTGSSGVVVGEEPGDPEDTEITVAIPFPDVTMYSMYVVGTAQGYYEEEGLTVEVITADNVNAAVSSGSADIGVESAGAVIEAIRGGVEIDILSGHFCRQNFDFAVQPDMDSVQDLDGTSVVLAGTSGDPAEFQRAAALADAGWDLESVDVDIVYPGPDSATWREFFVNERVSLIPFYGDDRPALEEYGANIVVESLKPWANDLQIAGDSWLEENPNTAVRFLRATMRALEFMTVPAVGEVPENKDAVLDIYEENEFDVADLRVQDSPWVLDGHLACPNLYFDEAAWDLTIETQQLEPLDFGAEVDLSFLLAAQDLLGLDNDFDEDDDLGYP